MCWGFCLFVWSRSYAQWAFSVEHHDARGKYIYIYTRRRACMVWVSRRRHFSYPKYESRWRCACMCVCCAVSMGRGLCRAIHTMSSGRASCGSALGWRKVRDEHVVGAIRTTSYWSFRSFRGTYKNVVGCARARSRHYTPVWVNGNRSVCVCVWLGFWFGFCASGNLELYMKIYTGFPNESFYLYWQNKKNKKK